MRELFQVLDREDRISILKLLSLLIKESNKTTYNDNSDWILAFNEAGFRTDDININEILSNVDMDVYNVPLEDWQVQALNSICFLENILIFRYVPDNEPKEAVYIQREAETYRKIDKYIETRSHTDGFRRNNANRWNKREICRFYLYSSIIWF